MEERFLFQPRVVEWLETRIRSCVQVVENKCAGVEELADALASAASGLTVAEVRVLFPAPFLPDIISRLPLKIATTPG